MYVAIDAQQERYVIRVLDAVVAKDREGHTRKATTSFRFEPKDIVAPPDTTGMTFVCGWESLTVRWEAASNPHGDLARYRVRFATTETPGVLVEADADLAVLREYPL